MARCDCCGSLEEPTHSISEANQRFPRSLPVAGFEICPTCAIDHSVALALEICLQRAAAREKETQCQTQCQKPRHRH